jgi:GIY-YIG catalytic domain
MFYYLYQITNLVNNKIYVGVHKTHDMNDGYMGSGKIIRSAIAKHGISNFSKVILEYFDTSEAMYAKEKKVVTEEFLSREDVYNLQRGGQGGFDYINAHCGNQGERLNRALSNEQRAKGGKASSTRCKELHIGIYSPTYISPFISNKELQQSGNSPEGRAKASKTSKITFALIGHQQKEKNSQFGKMWITNEQESIKIHKTQAIPDGWRKGRVLKNKIY